MVDDVQVQTRRATDGDVRAIATIWSDGWRDGHAGHVPEALAEFRRPEQFLARTPARIPTTTVATVDGRVVGFVTVIDDELEQVYVAADARGGGVADALMAVGEAAVAADGYEVAWLAVVAGNARARRFYERCGWSDAGPLDYLAQTDRGEIEVSTRRYEKRVAGVGTGGR